MPKTKKPANHKKLTKPTLNSYKKPLIIAFVIVFVLTLILPRIFPYHYYRYIKCGQEPVKVMKSAIGDDQPEYVLPNSIYYHDDDGFNPLIATTFYCSEQEAEAAGFSKVYSSGEVEFK